MRKVMAERGLSFRGLAERTVTVDGRGLSNGYIAALVNGRSNPTTNNLYVLARAAGVEPTYWVEYREHLAAERARVLTREIGLDEVLAKLDELQGENR